MNWFFIHQVKIMGNGFHVVIFSISRVKKIQKVSLFTLFVVKHLNFINENTYFLLIILYFYLLKFGLYQIEIIKYRVAESFSSVKWRQICIYIRKTEKKITIIVPEWCNLFSAFSPHKFMGLNSQPPITSHYCKVYGHLMYSYI